MKVIVMKIVVKEGSAVVAGPIGSDIGPLASDGLDEALGLSVGLGTIRFGEAVLDAKLLAGGGEEFGAISRTSIGEHALDVDAVVLVEADGLMESVEDAGDFLVGTETGKSEARVIVDGDVEAFDAGTWIAKGAIAGGADAGACEAAQLLDVEVEEFAGSVAFVTDDRRLWGLEGGQAVEAVAAKHAGHGGLGNGEHHEDLGVRSTLAAEGKDAGLELATGLAGLAARHRGVIFEALWEAGCFGASQPAADGSFTDAEGDGGVAQREAELAVSQRHLGSRERGEFGISVHVVRAGGRWVECSSTTSLIDPFRADNVLKHDT